MTGGLERKTQMIKVHDNRDKNEHQLHTVEVGGFFMINGILYRRCWWDINSFNSINYETDCFVCMNMADGELVVLRYDQWVERIPNRQIELSVED